MNIEEFNKEDILRDFEYELNKLCRSCIGTATEIKIKQQPLINLFEKIVWFYKKEKEQNKEYKNLLIDMVNQFAYEDNNPKTRGSSEQKIYTAGLSTLEDAFYLLDIDEGIKREDLWNLKEE